MYRYQQTTLSSMVKLAIATDQSSKVATRKIPVMFVAVQQNRQKSSCIQSGQVLNVASVTKQLYNEKHFEAILKAPVALPLSRKIDSTTETPKKVQLPSNIVMRYCPDGENSEAQNMAITKTRQLSKRPLLVMLAWLEAKEIHMEKYRQFWFERGYDILSVRTLPQHLLLPKIGGRNNAVKMIEFLTNHHLVYDEILIHGFSVGGYQMGEIFLYLLENKDKNERVRHVYESLKGIIVDSLVYAQDCPPGASKAITTSPIWQPMLEKTIDAFLKATKSFTYDRYLKVQDIMFANESKIPGCILHSKADVVSSIPHNIEIYHGWKSRNPENSEIHCWHDALHVLIYKKYPEQYTKVVDEFVANKTKITKAKWPKPNKRQ
ncbi:LOW QUALITY PROTEIN: transmembrane protein 53 [Dermatophagoides farinae]|uniref:Duf829 domain containing protein n=1 Tax=Dermatophagoides farinae TaxID=6954 RepID=A0A922IES1_DERFA|nr:uncharacterized protein LOC124498567 [Dermatophagoides farinae]KAH7636619.1 duf829 domain containing protein [Dermatophagoides farinae]KAH9528735.1 hypothetical protein DERF_002652 [Dermatophagoides farinae]